mmetsp:Transcript_36332/g.86262  ORF Transcript_36332/g.86262 Transcript_36332/m.86262 type:complete len:237 (-) Transcript_36332:1397-2107(-)
MQSVLKDPQSPHGCVKPIEHAPRHHAGLCGLLTEAKGDGRSRSGLPLVARDLYRGLEPPPPSAHEGGSLPCRCESGSNPETADGRNGRISPAAGVPVSGASELIMQLVELSLELGQLCPRQLHVLLRAGRRGPQQGAVLAPRRLLHAGELLRRATCKPHPEATLGPLPAALPLRVHELRPIELPVPPAERHRAVTLLLLCLPKYADLIYVFVHVRREALISEGGPYSVVTILARQL